MRRVVHQHFMGHVYELNYVRAFFGTCKGVALVRRAGGDRLGFEILSEDDGHWHVSSGSTTDSYWLQDLLVELERADAWLKFYATRVKDGYELSVERECEIDEGSET